MCSQSASLRWLQASSTGAALSDMMQLSFLCVSVRGTLSLKPFKFDGPIVRWMMSEVYPAGCSSPWGYLGSWRTGLSGYTQHLKRRRSARRTRICRLRRPETNSSRMSTSATRYANKACRLSAVTWDRESASQLVVWSSAVAGLHMQDAVAMDEAVSSLEYIDEDRAGGRPKRRR